MIHRLLTGLPKAAVVALGTIVIAGGAVGAAASAGGGPRPVNAVFSALGFGLESDVDGDSATATPSAGKHKGQAARATATGTALPGKDLPSKGSIPGLCRASQSGSENGRAHKLEATAFKRLQNAADAAGAEDLDAYCDDVLAGRKATPVATSTATATATQSGLSVPSKGRSDNADSEKKQGKSEEHRPAYSPASIASGTSVPGKGPETKGTSESNSSGASGSSALPKGKSQSR